MVQGSEISTPQQNPTKEWAESQLKTSIIEDLKKNKNKATKNHTPPPTHPNPKNKSNTVSPRAWRTRIRQDSWGRSVHIRFKKKKKSVLCIPAASPQEASDQPGPAMTYVRSWGPCQTQHASLVLYCQPHFLALCSIRSANNRTSLCLRFLKDSRSGRKRKKKKKNLTSHIQSIVTCKLCKRRHVSGIICQLMSLFSNASCSLLYTLIVGVLN